MEIELSRAVDLSPDIREPFGGEDSYWTVYRMFVAGDNLGRPRTMDEVWDYLSKKYDMTAEDSMTIHQTLLDWAADLQTDALEKLQIDGLFVYINHTYAFAERVNSSISAEAKRSSVAGHEARVATRGVVSRPVDPSEFMDPVLRINRVIIRSLKGFDGGLAKQSELKRAVVSNGYEVDPDDLQYYIDQLVDAGRLYKARRGQVAYLSLTPIEFELQENSDERETHQERLLDIDTALDILGALCAPGTHYAQRLTMSNLWRRIHETADKSEAIPDGQTEILKQACRKLQSLGLVSAGGEKMGTGGSVRTKSATSTKRRRSASQHVYKAGLVSQDVKKEIQDVLNEGDIETYLLDRLQ